MEIGEPETITEDPSPESHDDLSVREVLDKPRVTLLLSLVMTFFFALPISMNGRGWKIQLLQTGGVFVASGAFYVLAPRFFAWLNDKILTITNKYFRTVAGVTVCGIIMGVLLGISVLLKEGWKPATLIFFPFTLGIMTFVAASALVYRDWYRERKEQQHEDT